ncbi:uncharacterized protein LOC130792069 [Actinidia eriantha]|uniref:uncharacterized protein LOC130792069 n=1 Tax=Actinidia eriantha TaxID=165200 RepID=UPI00258FE6BE|nr:uncharacterized protein LOC130792069 [Actinidia eriantha]
MQEAELRDLSDDADYAASQQLIFVTKNYAFRSAEDANVFLVNDFQDRLQRTLSSLELPRAVAVANGLSSSVLGSESSSIENQEKTEGVSFDGSPIHIQQNGRRKPKFQDPARDLSIQVLEKFSLVTRFARETTSHIFRESHSDSHGSNHRRTHNETPIDYPSNDTSKDVEKVPDEIPVASDPLEFEKLTLVWGKPRQAPLGSEEGMSDLLSPILFILRDESESFWCFVALMERLGPNFNRGQNGMHSQLFALCKLVELLDNPLHNYFKQNDCLNYFFCFRWFLYNLKVLKK